MCWKEELYVDLNPWHDFTLENQEMADYRLPIFKSLLL